MKSDNVSMNGKQEEVIKKDNKRAKKGFAMIMLVSLIAGGCLGVLSVSAGRNIPVITKVFQEFMAVHAEILSVILDSIMIIVTIIASIWCIRKINRNKKKTKEFMENGDDTELVKIEKDLSYGVCITNGLMILQFLYFSVTVFIFVNFLAMREKVGFLLCAAVIFLAGILVLLLLQQKQVDCIRLLNPEKKGSIYDINFHKKWEDSCDEAELFVIYKAAYKTYRVANMLYIVLWVFFMLLGITTGAGFLPILTVMILWAASVMVFSYHSMKEGRRKDG